MGSFGHCAFRDLGHVPEVSFTSLIWTLDFGHLDCSLFSVLFSLFPSSDAHTTGGRCFTHLTNLPLDLLKNTVNRAPDHDTPDSLAPLRQARFVSTYCG